MIIFFRFTLLVVVLLGISSAFMNPPWNFGAGKNNLSLEAMRRPVRVMKPSPKESPLSLTNVLIATNALIYFAGKNNIIPNLDRRFMKIDAFIRRGETHRLLTSIFLHGSIQHLLFNCYSLYQIGPQTEKVFGQGPFVFIFIMSGVIANIATYLLKSSPHSLGASGGLYGMIGAFAMYYFRNKRVLGQAAEAGLESIKRTVLINLLYNMGGNVDHMAHLFGFIGGGVVSFLIGPNYKIKEGGYGSKSIMNAPLVPYRTLWTKLKIALGLQARPVPRKEDDDELRSPYSRPTRYR